MDTGGAFPSWLLTISRHFVARLGFSPKLFLAAAQKNMIGGLPLCGCILKENDRHAGC
jgi:hypothetical protein